MKLKYVIIDGMEPIVFGELSKHSDFLRIGNITSAGFVTFEEVENDGNDPRMAWSSLVYYKKTKVFGTSSSLGIGPDVDNDEKCLDRLFNS